MVNNDERIIEKWFSEVWNQGNVDLIDKMFDEYGRLVCPLNPKETPLCGLESYKAFLQSLNKLISELKITIEQIDSGNNKVTAFCRANFKKTGNTEDTSKDHEIFGLCVFKIKNQKIIDIWTDIDFLGVNK